jgi:probable H4MPT-linked C1 transfer pathway protein
MSDRTIILGLDIGGANTKAALIDFLEDNIQKISTNIRYYPFWEENIQGLPKMLNEMVSELLKEINIGFEDITSIAVTITAELSDAFQTKKEGIHSILKVLSEVFDPDKIKIISNENKFISVQESYEKYLNVAGANWVATALFIASYEKDCLLIDAGSTTIDLIPIENGVSQTLGKDDVSRLMNHELIYTGALRATIPSITHIVPYKGVDCRISFEKFALIADVHRILGNISEEEYNCDTADNRSTSISDCYARLSRIICGDLDLISKDDINSIANYIYNAQLKIVESEIKLFLDNLMVRLPQFKNNPLFITTGLGEDFLINVTLHKLGYNNVKSFSDLVEFPDKVKSSAIAVAGALKHLN